MSKKPTRNRRVSVIGAISVHAEANKSDPFAAKRAALHLARHPGEKVHMAEQAERLSAAQASRQKRNGCADWLSEDQALALASLRNGLADALKKRPARRPRSAGVRTGRILAAA
jgi:hypothetical protein